MAEGATGTGIAVGATLRLVRRRLLTTKVQRVIGGRGVSRVIVRSDGRYGGVTAG